MVAVGVDVHAEVFVGLYQSLCIFKRILRMNVVVGQSVAEQQRTMQLVGTGDGVVIIACGVLLWSLHETFCIDGVVVAPAGRRCHGNAGLEDGASLAHAHQRTETAVAPSPDANVVGIDILLLAQPKGCLHLVASFQLTYILVRTLLEVGTSCTRSSTIDAHHDETALCQVGIIQTTVAHAANRPGILHLLAARPAILPHDDGILLGRVEVGRFHHHAIEFHTL